MSKYRILGPYERSHIVVGNRHTPMRLHIPGVRRECGRPTGGYAYCDECARRLWREVARAERREGRQDREE